LGVSQSRRFVTGHDRIAHTFVSRVGTLLRCGCLGVTLGSQGIRAVGAFVVVGLRLCPKLCFGFGCPSHFSDFEPAAVLELRYLPLQVLRLHGNNRSFQALICHEGTLAQLPKQLQRLGTCSAGVLVLCQGPRLFRPRLVQAASRRFGVCLSRLHILLGLGPKGGCSLGLRLCCLRSCRCCFGAGLGFLTGKILAELLHVCLKRLRDQLRSCLLQEGSGFCRLLQHKRQRAAQGVLEAQVVADLLHSGNLLCRHLQLLNFCHKDARR